MLLGYIWLLGTFVNSSCDIKINVNIDQNCCRNLAVRGLGRAKIKLFDVHALCRFEVRKESFS